MSTDQVISHGSSPVGGRADGRAEQPVTAETAKQSIDDLVSDALRYRGSHAFRDLLRFMGRFRRYKPFNAMLIHVQLPGAAFVEPAHRWLSKYGRTVKPGERPLVVLQPFGPIMLVFDVSQTVAEPGAPTLPEGVLNPFSMPPLQGVDAAMRWVIENAKSDGVRVNMVSAGSLSAGCISRARPGSVQLVEVRRRPPETQSVPIRYETEVNRSFSGTEQYATLAHELAHLYCGHLGSSKDESWHDRPRVSTDVAEFEAESAAFIACQRLDDSAQMPPYLEQYLTGLRPSPPRRVAVARLHS